MGVTKQVIKQGNGVDKPKKGDNVSMEYTGWINENGSKGKQLVHRLLQCLSHVLTP